MPHHRQFLSFLATLWILFTFPITSRAFATVQAEPTEMQEPVTVFIVRHAEKSKDHPRDPNLSAVGLRRAQGLRRQLESVGITHLYSTPYKRTRQTLEPLAQHTGVGIQSYSPREPEEFARQLRNLSPGSKAVVAGHSNTVPGLAEALGCSLQNLKGSYQGQPILMENEYDRLLVLHISGNRKSSLLEMRYDPAPPEPVRIKDYNYIYLLRLVDPKVATDPTAEQQEIISEHFVRLQKLTRQRDVLLAGPCTDAAFGIVIFRAPDADAAQLFMEADPAIARGVMTGEVHPFSVSLSLHALPEDS